MSEVSGGGAAPSNVSSAEMLAAGPIHMKLEDGQLRYLRVGDKEIIRRIYFGVRDQTWATATPKYTSMKVEKGDDHFVVRLEAECKMEPVDYSWKGTITGTADGKITFQADGVANADFGSNRIGLCVLLGTPSLAKQAFETDGTPGKGEFPLLISPIHVAEQFHTLRYMTAEGLSVACSVEGATFDMEDQRNWGDSSWKAFAPLPYAYPQIKKGQAKSETVTIAVSGAIDAKPSPQDPVKVKIGQAVEGARIPAFGTADTLPDFPTISFHRDDYKDKKVIAWSYIPTTHLPDNDTIMENVPAIADQAKAIRSFNANAELHVGPIHIPGAKANDPVAAAWMTAMVKSLALGGVDEAAFEMTPASAAAIDAMRPYAKQKLLAVETEPRDARHLITFAAENGQGTGLFLVNRTGHACHAEIEGLGTRKVEVLHVGAGMELTDVEAGTLKLELPPYGVYRVAIAK